MYDGVILISWKFKVDLRLYGIFVEIYIFFFIKEEGKSDNIDCFVLEGWNYKFYNIIILVVCVEFYRL